MRRHDLIRSVSALADTAACRSGGVCRPAYARLGPSASRSLAAAGLLSLLALAGCQTSRDRTGSIGRPDVASSTSTAMAAPVRDLSQLSAADLAGAVKVYGASYEKNPKDKGVGLTYAAALQATGRNDQSLAVMQQVAINHPTDRDVLAAYGKALAAAGELPKALETVRRAQTPDRPDWRLLSAEGAILDQLGERQKARILYEKALVLQPEEPSVLSNLGMSALLANDLPTAETYLKRAAAQPGADARVRQNLALVVGLQGRFDEAKSIATSVLSPDEAQANTAYLKQMLSQRNTWSELERDGRRS
ncbi:tetratricopeptide repeat protein [Aureimonas pseudogalii]|uniref:Flp pilus assembly protein TadD n=1 Tax=Aureimonas pseudogalii TaxID=1744844 RepID=A0A7W6EGI2_9HYPH|nr:tetratricopeptide repeat protein [Aureimonas pseudogalii]MBB3997888.1 Flp pilus assembly protein TadD [Aureimonas pseudogalii]